MLPTLNVQAMRVVGGSGNEGDLNRILPVGRELPGTVKMVSQDQLQNQAFRIQIEANNRLIELITSRPIALGSLITLSRNAGGQLQIQLPATAVAPPPPPPQSSLADRSNQNTAAGPRALTVQVAATSAAMINSLPANTPQTAVLLPQPGSTPATTTAQAGNAAQPAATSPATVTAQGSAPAAPAPAAPATTAPAATIPATAQNAAPASQVAPVTAQTAVAPANSTNPGTGTTNASATQTQTPASAAPAQQGQQTSPLAQAVNQVSNNASNLAVNSIQIPNVAPSTANAAASATTVPSASQSSAQATASAPASGTAGMAAPAIPATPAVAAANTQATQATPATTPATPPSPLPASLTQADTVQRPSGFPVRVMVAGQIVELISPRPLQTGQQITLSRSDSGQVQIQFPPTPLPLAQQPAIQSAMQQALREVLPLQIPLADGLNQLMQLSAKSSTQQNNALNQLVQSMLNMFSVKPGSEDADKAIQRNLQQGGLLSEARLHQGSTDRLNQGGDLKQQLGQLLKLADQLPTAAREQLTQLVNSLLARSTAQQIGSLQNWRELPDGGQERQYRLDLPILLDQKLENAELKITEHRRRNEEGEFVTAWTVRLHFTLDEFGKVDAEISLKDGWELTTSFWAEQPETVKLIRDRLPGFETDLRNKGFQIESIGIRLGKPANHAEQNPITRHLVDLHT
ncbi:flagellar hook-length control protein FliK [Nitrincola alkalilacustris]|uniref:flagellar hook-length control protein FliK n=1 Tax=Nitrincola alkalilacustris TaxID=1571224 RepID=UPI00124D8426|nr:flagellar hook-length control protein FliK [Nitrincola alkalilacustris]